MHMASILLLKVLIPLIWAASSSSRTASMLRPCLEFIKKAVAVIKRMTTTSEKPKVVSKGTPGTPFAPSSAKERPPTLMLSCRLLKIRRIASPTPSVAMQK